jgi:hypothetical protein
MVHERTLGLFRIRHLDAALNGTVSHVVERRFDHGASQFPFTILFMTSRKQHR